LYRLRSRYGPSVPSTPTADTGRHAPGALACSRYRAPDPIAPFAASDYRPSKNEAACVTEASRLSDNRVGAGARTGACPAGFESGDWESTACPTPNNRTRADPHRTPFHQTSRRGLINAEAIFSGRLVHLDELLRAGHATRAKPLLQAGIHG